MFTDDCISMINVNLKSNKLLFVLDNVLARFVLILWSLLECVLPTKMYQKIARFKENEVLHNVLGLALFNALGGILLLVTQIKLANYMGASTYGVYSYCIAVGEVGAMFVRYGRNKTMTRDLIQHPERQRFLIANTFMLGICNLVIYLGIIFLFHKHLDLSWGFVLLLMAPCLISLDFQPVYEAFNLMSWHSIYYLIQKTLFLISVWLLIISPFSLSLFHVGAILFSSWLLILVLQYREVCTRLSIHVFKSFKWQDLGILYKENFLIAFSCFFGIAFGPLIRLILKNYVDSTAVGVYSAGLQVFLIGQFMLNQVGRVGNPMMAAVGKQGCSQKQRKIFVRRYLLIMICCTIPFFIPLFFFSDVITKLFFTEEYSELSSLLPILACYLLILSVGVVYTQFLISMRKDKLYFIIYILGAIMTCVCAFVLIPPLGVLGAVLALCVPHGVSCLGYYCFSQNLLR